MNPPNWTQTEETFKTNIYNNDNGTFVLSLIESLSNIDVGSFVGGVLFSLLFVYLFQNTQNIYQYRCKAAALPYACMFTDKKQKPVDPGSRK